MNELPDTDWLRLRDLFLELVRLDAPSGREEPVRDYVYTFLRELGLDPREDDSASKHTGSCGNVLCKVGDGGDTLYLAHMDSVQSTAGIQPRLHDDRITSDGSTILAADNRAGIAALLAATERVLRDGDDHPNFTLGFTVREEVDGAGAAHLAIPSGIDQGLVFDSHLPPGHFVARGFGAMRFKATVHGRAAHAGNAPETGIHALVTACEAVSALPWGRLSDTLTSNVGSLVCDGPTNVVPDLTTLSGEVRSLDPGDLDRRMDDIRRAFDTACQRHGAKLEFESSWLFAPYRHDERSPLRQRVEQALRDNGLTPSPAISAGGSDANEFNGRGLPTINLGIGARNPHSTEEYILNVDLSTTSRVAERLMTGDRSK